MLRRTEILAKYRIGPMESRYKMNPWMRRTSASDICAVANAYLKDGHISQNLYPVKDDRVLTIVRWNLW